MRVLLVSTYELGHQPLHVASPAAALLRAGHDVRCVDLSLQPWTAADVGWAEAVAFSVPMHTAMRLAVQAARAVRELTPSKPVCFYGLYAPVSRDVTLGALADRLIAGEYEAALVRWAAELGGGYSLDLGHDDFALPARHLLPPLEEYAHLALGGEERVVGYVEASHGCAHTCRHCPLPVVYDGAIRLVPRDAVLEDVDALVGMGARHVTFGDPDFLNGWRHALRVVRDLHDRHPDVTFDVTTKVEHVLRHREVWDELRRCGCLFVVSAFECVDDAVLARLDKGHTAAEASEAVGVLRAAGIEPRPSWMPFTPWTTPQSFRDVLRFVTDHDLVGNVDPVQYSIRLLVPEGSLLLDAPGVRRELGDYDAESLGYGWTSDLDELQRRVGSIAQETEDVGAAFAAIWEAATPEPLPDGLHAAARPRLTEPWFC